MLPGKARIENAIGPFAVIGRLAGGDIAALHHLRTADGDYVLKSGGALPKGIFNSEALCLRLLHEAGVAVAPVIDQCEEFLLMRYLRPGQPDEAAAGAALARLHRHTAVNFGLVENTFLATMLQDNSPTTIWADFYMNQRVRAVIQQLSDISREELKLWTRFAERAQLLLNLCNSPSLLHGDLWAGNLYYSAQGPVFIDPACYFGDALVDIAMTKLFGGFTSPFYEAYAANSGKRESEAELVSVYQIYPLLVHAYLFGASYYRSACAIRDRFL